MNTEGAHCYEELPSIWDRLHLPNWYPTEYPPCGLPYDGHLDYPVTKSETKHKSLTSNK